jgi:hypothetical protein
MQDRQPPDRRNFLRHTAGPYIGGIRHHIHRAGFARLVTAPFAASYFITFTTIRQLLCTDSSPVATYETCTRVVLDGAIVL